MSSKNYAVKAHARDAAGKGAARSLRRQGMVPGVIYGDGKEPIKISIPAREINLEYMKGHMYTTLCDLDVDGQKHLVLARDVQMHVVKDTVEHVDFLRVTPRAKIAVFVPVHFINEDSSPGMKNKGTLAITRHEIELVCPATNIPDVIEIDLTPFDLGDVVKISHVKLPEGTKPVIERDFTIATINAPRTMASVSEETPAAEGAAAAAPAAAGAKAEPKKEAKK